MGFYSHEIQKLPSGKRKFFRSGQKDSCSMCHGFCWRARPSYSSDDDGFGTDITDIESKQMIISEIRKRAMKAKLRQKEYGSLMESLSWVFTPTTGKLLIASKEMHTGEEEEEVGHEDGGGGDDDDNEEDDTDTDDEEEDSFFSVRSCFSGCSNSTVGVEYYMNVLRGQSVLEEFRHCEGWPFGLYKKALMLPPLPSTPSDSWTWRTRNVVAKKL